MRQIINILALFVAVGLIVACGEKSNGTEKGHHGNFIESPILYQDKSMLSVISQYAADRDEVKAATDRRVDLICDFLLKNGWLKKNINYPSVKSAYCAITGEDMFKDWTVCVISIINRPAPHKSKMIVQCGAKGLKKPFLMREFDNGLPDDQFLNDLNRILTGLITAARQDALKLQETVLK
ncbi:MAG: hypothetical protein Q8L09_03465 [Candidatus Moranbacteria bacterium]|nr:hypothetical protein [Candidatus Moranbacteria bacterium]